MLNAKILLLTIFFIGNTAYAFNEREEVCEVPAAQVLSTNVTGQIESLWSSIQSELSCKELLANHKMTDEIKKTWEAHVNPFCDHPEFKDTCNVNGTSRSLDLTKAGLNQNFSTFVQESEQISDELKSKATNEVPLFICYLALTNKWRELLLSPTTSIHDKKSAINEIIRISDPASAIAELDNIYLLLGLEDNQAIHIPVFKHMLEEIHKLGDDEKNSIANFLEQFIQDEYMEETVRLTALESTFELAKRGSGKALTVLENTRSHPSSTISLQAREYRSELDSFLISSSVVPTRNLDPPKCSEWSEEKMNSSVYLSDSIMSDFYDFYQNEYGVYLPGQSHEVSLPTMRHFALTVGPDGKPFNMYSSFIQAVTPDPEVDSKKNNWINFVEKYASKGPSITATDRKERAALIYCRMQHLKGMMDRVATAGGDLNSQISAIKTIPLLAETDAWIFIDKIFRHNPKPEVQMELVEVIKALGTDRSLIYLDQLYMQNPSLRDRIIEAFKEDSISLKPDSRILAHLRENKDSPGSKAHLSRLLEILEEKQRISDEQSSKHVSLNSLAEGNLAQFTSVVEGTYVSPELQQKTSPELEAIIIGNAQQISQLEEQMGEARKKLMLIQREGSGDPATSMAQLQELRVKVRALEYSNFMANLQLNVNELKIKMGSETSTEEEKTTHAEIIIGNISAELFKNRASEEDNFSAQIIAEIKSMVIAEANASDDTPGTTNDQQESPTISNSNEAPPRDNSNLSGQEIKEEQETTLTLGENRETKKLKFGHFSYNPKIKKPIPFYNPVKAIDFKPVEEVVESTNSEDESSDIEKVGFREKPAPSPNEEVVTNDDFDSGVVEPEVINNQDRVNHQNSEPEKRTPAGASENTEQTPSIGNSKIEKDINNLKGQIEHIRSSNRELANPSQNQNSPPKESVIDENTLSGAKKGSTGNKATVSSRLGENSNAGSRSRAPASSQGPSGMTKQGNLQADKSTAAARRHLPKGQIDTNSLNSKFVQEIEGEDLKGWEYMTVALDNQAQERTILSLLSNPEVATCEDLQFLDVFFKQHISKVKFNKQGDAQLLVKSGNIPFRVIKPSETKVKALQDKYCNIGEENNSNTRHTASIDPELENLPEEGSSPIVRKRNKSGALSKIIDGIRGFFQ